MGVMGLIGRVIVSAPLLPDVMGDLTADALHQAEAVLAR